MITATIASLFFGVIAFAIYISASVSWFLHRVGDKHEKDKRLWVLALDFISLPGWMFVGFILALFGKLKK